MKTVGDYSLLGRHPALPQAPAWRIAAMGGIAAFLFGRESGTMAAVANPASAIHAQVKGSRMDDQIMNIVRLLAMRPHPEGGFYFEAFRSSLVLNGLPHGVPRNASTAIYFLLPAGTFSAFHRVRSDEVWHHYDGDPLALHIIDEKREHQEILLGRDFSAGQRPQAVVPADAWQAAEPVGKGFSLCGCTVAPGFDFADFELAKSVELTARFPEYAAIIARFTRI